MKRRTKAEIAETMKKHGSAKLNHYAYVEVITPRKTELQIEGPISEEYAALLSKVARMEGSVDPSVSAMVDTLADLFGLDGERRTPHHIVECAKNILNQLRRAEGSYAGG